MRYQCSLPLCSVTCAAGVVCQAILGTVLEKKKVSFTMLNITTTITTATTSVTLLCCCYYHHYIPQCATNLSYPVEAMESLALYVK